MPNSSEARIHRLHYPWRYFRRVIWIQTGLVVFGLGLAAILIRATLQDQFVSRIRAETGRELLLWGEAVRGQQREIQKFCLVSQGKGNMELQVFRDSTLVCETGRQKTVASSERYHEEVLELEGGWKLVGRRMIRSGTGPLSLLRSRMVFWGLGLGSLLALGVYLSSRLLSRPLSLVLERLNALENPGLASLYGPGGGRLKSEEFEWGELQESIEKMQKDLEAERETRRRARGQLFALLNGMSDPVLAIGTQEQVLFYNAPLVSLIGQEPDLEKQLKIRELFRQVEVWEVFREVLQTGIPKQLRALEWGQSRVDLSRRFFTLSVSPLKRPKSEEVYGALGVFHDISELKLAEQMRIDFVGNVSHELRTPLSSIRGYAETMLEDLEQRATTEAQFARTIVRNVERLIELVTDLLDLSSLDAGVEKLHREWLPARELVGPVFEQFRPRMKERKLELVLEGKDVRVFSDRKRMEQVLVNLIDNASKFSPEQGRITVSFEDRPFEVILSVRDQGVGIPPESLPRVFERFYRVDSGRSRHQGGTGLGLAIVKHIVQRHGGNVRVESDLSRGSVFFCRIPKA